MIINKKTHQQKRIDFRVALNSGKLLEFPGAYNPMVAMMVEQYGYDGVYCSGAVMANSLGLPDIGLTTMSEVTQFAGNIAKVTSLPTIMDVDTGFGEVMNMVRTIQEVEHAGVAGCHLEDQVNPKRCGHLNGKQLVTRDEMAKKVKAAVDSRNDDNFLVIARTDARAVEGFDSAVDRAKAYVDAGADMIFPEAIKTQEEFESFRKAVNVPLLANMTEFGKSRLLTRKELENLGYNLVIYPVTTQRLAMYGVEQGLKAIKETGSADAVLDIMQTRSRLYELLNYPAYNNYDDSLYNFELTKEQ
jgi:methylisocitrate lyase|tara:strand:+ start:312 stop:1217 length:906 start_codon:yes stop_codon:yes gene_type:complete